MTRSKKYKIIDILKKTYPDAKCGLDFNTPLELLVATILSAQCTDRRVNVVTKVLFKRCKTLDDYINLNPNEFELIIKTVGMANTRTKNIIASCKIISEKYGGKIPKTLDELVVLPGVGRKTANVVLSNAFQIASGIAVDTHVSRVSQRLGLTKEKLAEKIEKDLMKLIPKKDWIMISHQIIQHGREVCGARSPDCGNCVFKGVCGYN